MWRKILKGWRLILLLGVSSIMFLGGFDCDDDDDDFTFTSSNSGGNPTPTFTPAPTTPGPEAT